MLNKRLTYGDGVELGVKSRHCSVVEVESRHFCKEERRFHAKILTEKGGEGVREGGRERRRGQVPSLWTRGLRM